MKSHENCFYTSEATPSQSGHSHSVHLQCYEDHDCDRAQDQGMCQQGCDNTCRGTCQRNDTTDMPVGGYYTCCQECHDKCDGAPDQNQQCHDMCDLDSHECRVAESYGCVESRTFSACEARCHSCPATRQWSRA